MRWRTEFDLLRAAKTPGTNPQWLALYEKIADFARAAANYERFADHATGVTKAARKGAAKVFENVPAGEGYATCPSPTPNR